MVGKNIGPPLIEVDALTKAFRHGAERLVVLDAVSLAVEPGEFVCIIGPSGCGKSTLMRCIAGLIRPDTGHVVVAGQAVGVGPSHDVGVVFQDPLLLEWRSVVRNVTIQMEFRGQRWQAYRERALGLLGGVGLAGHEYQMPWQLSGGMKQRVALCRALIHSPSILLLDEPFGALDMLTRDQLNSDVAHLCSANQVTSILITHSIEEAVFLGDRVLVMGTRPGTIVADVPVQSRGERSERRVDDPEMIVATKEVRELFRKMGVLRA